ncbi:hypothetical protein, conserved [Eimeria praecox]|uniref:Uncharacterized protein n=1 Tax=Eimeria praecox TaxID=51316 RepID=U6H3U1_9EIME|nr:hypothetical protein, conserved [Eimeria praecox]
MKGEGQDKADSLGPANKSTPLASCLPETDEFIALHEEASELLLRKAVVQAVLRREKTVAELLYHPAALRAAGLPHWKDKNLEMEQQAALGNNKTEKRLMKRVVATQEEYLNKSQLARSLSKQPYLDSDIGVLVLLLNRQDVNKGKRLRHGGCGTT